MNTPNNNLAEARRTTNLRVLQRLDPQIVDLAITASHVVLYQFSLQTQQWVKRNVEGSLFVCKRSQVPRFTLIVSNRNSTENLEVGITSTFQMQVREPYLIFRDSAAASSASSAASSSADEAIRGLWFHDDKEREQVHSYLENVVKSLQKIEQMERENGPPPSLLMTPNNKNADNDDGNDSNNVNNATTTVKTNKGPPVEVNTNAAGAALLSTLTLNDNTKTTTTAIRSRKKQPLTSSPSSSPPPTTTTTTQSNNTTTTTTTPSSSSLSTQSSNNNTLDKKSLQLALLSLIQDERFLDLIHAQYLKVASSRAQREQQQQQQQQQNNLHR